MKAIKSDSDSDSDEQKRWSVFEKKKLGMTPQNWRLKRSPVFSGKNRVVTSSVAAPGVTHSSDATANSAPPDPLAGFEGPLRWGDMARQSPGNYFLVTALGL